MSLLIDPAIAARVDRIELPFNRFGVDPYGVAKEHVARFMTLLHHLYHHYFTVGLVGTEHVPPRGRGMLVGNHSGGVAVDGAMVIASCFFDKDPPRLAQGMAEKFIARFPFASLWSSRTGQFTGLPEQAAHLLEDERLLMVFPEGSRGTAKLYSERNSLVQFGTGFMRLALKTQSPIIPFGFVGGGEAVPTIANAYRLGRLLGVPYIPVTPWLAPIPLPVRVELTYGEPMIFSGTGTEEDEVIQGYVDQVKQKIADLMEEGQRRRRDEASARPRGAEEWA
ncbi:lysophospholipid acyltransferase family protein [Chondromyces crocatus]|uniref:Acyltransferase n=1 Tax=Chondromyces crocatus TaxID=52 RepID=A0A0K1EPW9_CHOCO|nr:lysophospholipid acyltransferase family protein [Chondromyces crocatus]AKT42658.1 acyltransferase [Chondromyces crocatus]